MDTSELAGRCGNTFPVNWGSIKRKPVIEWAIIACSIAANMGGYLTCLLNGCVPLQTQLRMVLDKQTETGQEWFKPTEPSGTIHLCGFFFLLTSFILFVFLGLYMGRMEQVPAHPVQVPGTPCLHHLLVLAAPDATNISFHSWEVRNSWMRCQISQFHRAIGYQTTLAQP